MKETSRRLAMQSRWSFLLASALVSQLGCSGRDSKVGALGGPCTRGGACDPGLTCASKTCVDLSTIKGVDAASPVQQSPSAQGGGSSGSYGAGGTVGGIPGGSGSTSSGGSHGSSGTSSPSMVGNCPDLSGSWRMAASCEDKNQIGQTMTLVQKDCTLTGTAGVSLGWNGGVGKDGATTLSGTAGSSTMSCAGTASSMKLTLSCNSSCVIAFTRPLVSCQTDNDCGSGLGCDPTAVSVGNGYCTPLCNEDEECPSLIECPGMVARAKGDCKDKGNHKGKGYCDQYQSNNGPSTCSKAAGTADAGTTSSGGGATSGTPTSLGAKAVGIYSQTGSTCSASSENRSGFVLFLCPGGRISGGGYAGPVVELMCGSYIATEPSMSNCTDKVGCFPKVKATVRDVMGLQGVTDETSYPVTMLMVNTSGKDALWMETGCSGGGTGYVILERSTPTSDMTESDCNSSTCTSKGASGSCGTDCDCGHCWYCESGTCRYGGQGSYGCYRGCGG